MHPIKSLVLGTALWGWTVDRSTAFALLDAFYAAGGRLVDCATNYPINKEPADWRRAETWLGDWVDERGVQDLHIIMKVGSLNNLRSPEHNLSSSFLLLNLGQYQSRFGSNLGTLMIHWDNRSDEHEIRATLRALTVWRERGVQVGLSGLRHPEVYAGVWGEYGLGRPWIECKHNVVQSDLERYRPLHDVGRFMVYGINGGGLKLRREEYDQSAALAARGGAHAEVLSAALSQWLAQWPGTPARPAPGSMNHIGMLYAWWHPMITALIIGPSRPEQLEDSIWWAGQLAKNDYQDAYESLCKTVAMHAS